MRRTTRAGGGAADQRTQTRPPAPARAGRSSRPPRRRAASGGPDRWRRAPSGWLRLQAVTRAATAAAIRTSRTITTARPARVGRRSPAIWALSGSFTESRTTRAATSAGDHDDAEHRQPAGRLERDRQPRDQPAGGQRPRRDVAADHTERHGGEQDEKRLEHAEEPQPSAAVAPQRGERELAATEAHGRRQQPREQHDRDQDQREHGRLRPSTGRRRARSSSWWATLAGCCRGRGRARREARSCSPACWIAVDPRGDGRGVARRSGRWGGQGLVDRDVPRSWPQLDPGLGGEPRRGSRRHVAGGPARPGTVWSRPVPPQNASSPGVVAGR